MPAPTPSASAQDVWNGVLGAMLADQLRGVGTRWNAPEASLSMIGGGGQQQLSGGPGTTQGTSSQQFSTYNPYVSYGGGQPPMTPNWAAFQGPGYPLSNMGSTPAGFFSGKGTWGPLAAQLPAGWQFQGTPGWQFGGSGLPTKTGYIDPSQWSQWYGSAPQPVQWPTVGGAKTGGKLSLPQTGPYVGVTEFQQGYPYAGGPYKGLTENQMWQVGANIGAQGSFNPNLQVYPGSFFTGLESTGNDMFPWPQSHAGNAPPEGSGSTLDAGGFGQGWQYPNPTPAGTYPLINPFTGMWM